MKYAVPPATFAPLGAVGAVRPGPLVGLTELDDAAPDDDADPADDEPELLDELDPQALTTNIAAAAANATIVLRKNLRMLRILLRINSHLASTSSGADWRLSTGRESL